MEEQYSRTMMALGEPGVMRLRKAHVILFGLGGVGSFTAEALARAGIGKLTLIDGDKISVSNLNRQLPALHSTLGRAKVQVMAERIADIDPEISVRPMELFYSAETAEQVDFSGADYVADAIDTVSAKILLIERAKKLGIPVISCMGAGNKLDPTRFQVAEIEKTTVCPLAKAVRLQLRRLGITGVKAVFSTEQPHAPIGGQNLGSRKQTPASLSFVPSVAGLILAGEIIKDIAGVS